MPRAFLVKRRSPQPAVRSWDGLPDEERADTYIPGRAPAAAPRPAPPGGAEGAGTPRSPEGAIWGGSCAGPGQPRGGGRRLRESWEKGGGGDTDKAPRAEASGSGAGPAAPAAPTPGSVCHPGDGGAGRWGECVCVCPSRKVGNLVCMRKVAGGGEGRTQGGGGGGDVLLASPSPPPPAPPALARGITGRRRSGLFELWDRSCLSFRL